MTDPVRFLDGDRRGLGARLLASAAQDGPEPRSVERALAAAAALGTATLATSSASATAGVTSAAVWLKWLAVGAVAGGVTATTASTLFEARPVPPAPVVVVSPRELPAASTPEPRPLAPTIGPEVLPSAAPARPSSAPSASSAPEPEGDSLGAELGRMDAARRRQAAGDARGAIAELDRYLQDFPHARFIDEAALVRAESLAALGDCGGALRLARPAGDSGVLGRRWNALRERCR